MIETELTTKEQEFLAIVRQAQDYELPPLRRAMIRIKNGVPFGKIVPLFLQELEIARIKHRTE